MKPWFRYQWSSLTLNKNCSLVCLLPTLFLDQSLIQLLSVSNSGLKFGYSAVFVPPGFFVPDRHQLVDMFVNFYLLDLCENSIGFLTMSWSTICDGNDKISLFTLGARLDVQNWFPKLLVSLNFMDLIESSNFLFQFLVSIFGALYLTNRFIWDHTPLSNVLVLL